jgi:transposase-like protein
MTVEGLDTVFKQLKKALIERAMEAEMTHHLGYSNEAETPLLYLTLRNITKDWSRSAWESKSALNQFVILYSEPFSLADTR